MIPPLCAGASEVRRRGPDGERIPLVPTRRKRSTDDRSPEPDQEVWAHYCGRWGLLQGREGGDPRLPGPERGGEDDDHAGTHLLPSSERGHGQGGRLRRLRRASRGEATRGVLPRDAAPLS